MDNCYSLRFIPAGAGNTRRWLTGKSRVSVYPRWRGEHSQEAMVTESFNGLSPLARGTPELRPQREIAGRFIPAGAGNTRGALAPCGQPAVYPRWRGEH